MSWDDLTRPGVVVTVSEHDSRRFGRVVARGSVGSDVSAPAAARALVEGLEPLGAGVAVLRWPADLTGLGGALVRRGMQVVPADTLVYWAVHLGGHEVDGEAPVTHVGDSPARLRELDGLVRATFDGYPNHYAASRDLFPSALVLDGYVEWARRTARESPDGCLVRVVEDRMAALATTADAEGGRSVEVLLAGTAPAFRRRGVYGELLRGVLAHAAASGAERLVISTQASNTAVQGAWAAAGLRPVSAWTTVHVLQD